MRNIEKKKTDRQSKNHVLYFSYIPKKHSNLNTCKLDTGCQAMSQEVMLATSK